MRNFNCPVFLFCIFSFILFTYIGCKSPTAPKEITTAPDTTSHNFAFQSWHFGENSSSILYDVAIINANNIWACGEIYMNDSLDNPDPNPYGLVHWDGSSWEIKRIKTLNPSGGYSYIIPTGLFVIDSSNIWLVRGGVFLFDGDIIKHTYWLVNYSGYNGGIFNNNEVPKKLWGTSSKNLFVVGDQGALAHYDGTRWQKVQSGTDLDIYDIWGQKTAVGDYEVLCVASDQFSGKGKEVLQIRDNKVSSIPGDGLSSSLNTIWFVQDKEYFIGGDGLFSTQSLSSTWIRNTELPAYYKTSVRGNDINDFFVAGAFGLFLHYNGKSWMNYQSITYINGAFSRVDMKGNTVCTVGRDNNQAFIILGKR